MEPSATPRVVVIDDHALFRRGLCEVLAQHGIGVVGEASDGESGVALVEDVTPDVVVMDISMPGISGIEAARRVRSRSPSTRVIMLTVSPDPDDVTEAVLAGASGYLLKDAEPDQIASGVRAAAAGASLLSAPVAAQILDRVRTSHGSILPAEVWSRLSERELEVLKLIADGRENSEIAEELFISVQTVKNHVSSLLAKLEVDNRLQAAVAAVRADLI